MDSPAFGVVDTFKVTETVAAFAGWIKFPTIITIDKAKMPDFLKFIIAQLWMHLLQKLV